MKVSGFTFIRNAIKLDYPIVEAIRSILPLCDEVIVAVGNSEDDTLGLIQSIDPGKIKIIETVWDDTLRENGAVLADETNKAFQAISTDSDWAFYIQGDEVIHEKDHAEIRAKMELFLNDQKVDGLLFAYQHFYGSYDFIGDSPKWYAHEIRIVKPGRKVYSYKDAQGFRKGINEKLNVVKIPASIYHYGWVKDPRAMQQKQLNFNKYWHSDEWVKDKIGDEEVFVYSENIPLKKFTGAHPEMMAKRISKMNWKFQYDPNKVTISIKDKIKKLVYKYLGLELGYKNYRLIS